MQPLTMAMKTGQQEDSNGNQSSDLGTPGHLDSTTSGHPNQQQQHHHHHHHQHHVSPHLKASQNPLQCGSDPCLQTDNVGSALAESESLAHRQPHGPLSRPGQLFPGTDPSTSPAEECSDSFCHMASSAVDSDSSSSPDINSNTLLVGFGESDPSRGEMDNQTASRTSDAPSSVSKIVPPPADVEEQTGEGREVRSQPASSEKDQSGQVDIKSAFPQASSFEETGRPVGDVHPEELNRYVDQAGQRSPGEVTHSDMVSRRMYSSTDLTQHGDTRVPRRLSSPMTCSSDISLRQSVDMDVESEDTEEQVLNSDTEGVHQLCVPVPLPHDGSVGGPQLLSSSDNSADTLSSSNRSSDSQANQYTTVPASVLKEPCITDSSLFQVGGIGSDEEDSSSEVASLPTQSSFNELQNTDSSGTFWNTANPRDENLHKSSPSSHVKADAFHFSTSSATVALHSSSNGSQLGSGVSVSLSQSIAHNQSSQGLEGSWYEYQSAYPENAIDLEREDCEEEEELCEYAHRLVSRGSGRPPSGDRQELWDPVARLLSEGDRTHFIPIEEVLNHPTEARSSADAASHTPG